MDVFKQDTVAIDMVITALRKGHFFNIEGDEVLALSSHVQRLVHLKGRILKEIEVQADPVIPPASMNISAPRPIVGIDNSSKLEETEEKKVVNE